MLLFTVQGNQCYPAHHSVNNSLTHYYFNKKHKSLITIHRQHDDDNCKALGTAILHYTITPHWEGQILSKVKSIITWITELALLHSYTLCTVHSGSINTNSCGLWCVVLLIYLSSSFRPVSVIRSRLVLYSSSLSWDLCRTSYSHWFGFPAKNLYKSINEWLDQWL